MGGDDDEGGGSRPPRRAASKNVKFDDESGGGGKGGKGGKGGSKRAKRSTHAAPSAMHYVGYVEEDETPEMIMAKFEQLERIQRETEEAKKAQAAEKAAKAAEEGGEGVDGEGGGAEGDGDDDEKNKDNGDFDEEMLLKVFQQTSQFSVKSALAEDLMYGSHQDEDDPYAYYDDDGMQGVDGDFWNEIFGGTTKKRKRKGEGRVPKEKKPRAPPKPAKQHMITAYNSDNQMLMRKKKIVDPRAPNILKLPPHPIPVSWGRLVTPYKPADAVEAEKTALPDCVQVTAPILDTDLTQYGTDFLAVHVNPPWNIEDSPDRGGVTVEQIGTIPFQKLAPYGFVFMWAGVLTA